MYKHTAKNNPDISNKEATLFPIIIQEEKTIQRLTMFNLFRQVMDSLNFEKGYLHTIKMLIIDPANAIKGYFNIERYRYGNPAKFLIFTTAIASFLMLKSDSNNIYAGFQKEMSENGKNVDALNYAQNVQNFVSDYFNILMLIAVPFLSLSFYWLFKKSQYNFTEHLVINSYSLSIQNILFILLFPLFYVNPIGLQLYIVLSMVYQLYYYIRIFNLKIISGGLYTLLAISLGYTLYLVFLFTILIVYSFLYFKV